jgi:hypothetical protein
VLHQLPTLVVAAGAITMLLVVWVLVRRARSVKVHEGVLVLPHVDMARPRRRLAKGSTAFSAVDEVNVSALSRRTLRPSHARRSA